MKIFRCDILSFPLPQEQNFLVFKYELLFDLVVAGGLATPEELLVPQEATDEEMALAHDPDYLDRLLKGEFSIAEIREVGLPWSPRIVERARRTAGATIEACRWALKEGIALHLGGGTHHAFRDRAKGFCWLNDVAIAAKTMIAEGLAEKVLILDCDVHQGDGTAAIFHDDPDVFTFSIHGSSSYPYHKISSDLDIVLPVGAGDAAYLLALEKSLDETLDRFQPDLVIYLAGADVFEDDRFGCLALGREGIALRDRMIFGRFARLGTPVAVTLAGGYANRIEEAAEIHCRTARIALEFHERRKRGGLA